MISAAQFRDVFGAPEVPAESEAELVADWLLNHSHKEPSQRVKSALKSIAGSSALKTIVSHYYTQIRDDLGAIDTPSVAQLAKVREYFTFPLHYLTVDPVEATQITRIIDSLLKGKIKSLPRLSAEEEEFLTSLGWDTDEALKLSYEAHLHNQVSSFAGIWDEPVLDKLGQDNLSRKELSKLRISEIFDIVINFPQSYAALHDLKLCLEPSQRAELVSSFTSSCIKRLLHPGTNTNDIILCYTSTIKSFLIIDPRGVLLDNASRPIRRYLREREDTIPSIVHALLDEDPDNELSKLADELDHQTEKTIDTLTLEWIPDPIDALPDFKKLDIIESLISIFDSKDQFIEELVNSFAKKLLSYKSYNVSDINTKLSLLKPKFEENDLNNIDVMIRDLEQSDTWNTVIHTNNHDIVPNLEFIILSYLYWPEFESDTFKLPSRIQNQVDLYQDEFKKYKDGRTMNWINKGIVTLTLESKGQKKSFEVTPDKAAIISLFDDSNGVPSLTLAHICQSLEMGPATAKEALDFWIKNAVIELGPDHQYTTIE